MSRAKSWLATEIRELAKLAEPKDGSAPIQPIIDLGNLVLAHSERIARALEIPMELIID